MSHERIQTEQAEYFREHGRYKQVPMTGGIAVDVYEGPRGFGYIVREESRGKVKQTDYGPEGRTHDWREP